MNGSSVQPIASARRNNRSRCDGSVNSTSPAGNSGPTQREEQRTGAHLDPGHCHRVGLTDVALVERTENTKDQRRKYADCDAESHRDRRPTDHQQHAGNHREAEQQLTRIELSPHDQRLDERHQHRHERHARRADGSVRKLDRAVERQPVQRDQHADARVDRDLSCGTLRADRARTSAPRATQRRRASCATTPMAMREAR